MNDEFDVRQSIARKRAGGTTSPDIGRLMRDYVGGAVSDAQMAAWLATGSAVGFNRDEAAALTEAYVTSGEVLDLTGLEPTVDKHSTGGVGDATSLAAVPLAAACGLHVAKLSGRALGHTGGTLDKLEVFEGVRVTLDISEFRTQVAEVGCAIAAATDRLAPADKRIYALRDHTGTVDDPALIAASVMSKKIAGGARHILLDVKCGNGAFLVDVRDAAELARLCVDIGRAHGRDTAALVTDMSQPLAPAVGNALEVAAACRVLAGEAPAPHDRFDQLVVELVAELLLLAGRQDNLESARWAARSAISSGAGLERLGRMIAAQGGDARPVENPGRLPSAPATASVIADRTGYLTSVATREVGWLVHRLGGGRMHAGEAVDHRVGVTVDVQLGDRVERGQQLAVVHAAGTDAADTAAMRLATLLNIGDEPTAPPPLIRRRVADSAEGS